MNRRIGERSVCRVLHTEKSIAAFFYALGRYVSVSVFTSAYHVSPPPPSWVQGAFPLRKCQSPRHKKKKMRRQGVCKRSENSYNNGAQNAGGECIMVAGL